MTIKINGQQQMSFEQFEATFREVFGREMTDAERRWLSTVSFPIEPVQALGENDEDAA